MSAEIVEKRLAQARNFLLDKNIGQHLDLGEKLKAIEEFLERMVATGKEECDRETYRTVRQLLAVQLSRFATQQSSLRSSPEPPNNINTTTTTTNPAPMTRKKPPHTSHQTFLRNAPAQPSPRPPPSSLQQPARPETHHKIPRQAPPPPPRQHFAIPYNSLVSPSLPPSRRLSPEELGFQEWVEDLFPAPAVPPPPAILSPPPSETMPEEMRDFEVDRDGLVLERLRGGGGISDEEADMDVEEGHNVPMWAETSFLQDIRSREIERDLIGGGIIGMAPILLVLLVSGSRRPFFLAWGADIFRSIRSHRHRYHTLIIITIILLLTLLTLPTHPTPTPRNNTDEHQIRPTNRPGEKIG